MGKEKVQLTSIFYLKQNKEVQLDLQRLEIFIFSSLLPSLPPGKILEEKLTYRFKTFQKTASSRISTNKILQSQAQEFSANYVPLFFIITTHS